MDKDKQRASKNIDYSDIPPLTDVQLATMKPLREALPQAMPSAAEQAPLEQDEMLPEYDFTGKKGVRGKYHQAYRQGHTVKIEQADGTVDVHYFTLKDGAVMLEPDVREYFPTSESVNSALRALIALAPTKMSKT